MLKKFLRKNTSKFFLFLLFPSYLMATQQSVVPSWVLLENARRISQENNYEAPDLGRAVALLREALFLRGIYPEAEYFLANIYLREGNTSLAKLHLQESRQQKDFFKVKMDYAQAVYDLADISIVEGDFIKAIEYLREIAFLSESYQEAFSNGGLSKYNELFLEKRRGIEGFPLVFNLYRFPYDNSVKAHIKLAKIYYDLQVYSLAVNHFLFALIGEFSRVYDMVEYYEPDYTFETFRSFISKVKEYPRTRELFKSSQIWLNYVLLANAAYALNPEENYDLAFEMWRDVVEMSDNNLAIQIAKLQIQNPTVIKSSFF